MGMKIKFDTNKAYNAAYTYFFGHNVSFDGDRETLVMRFYYRQTFNEALNMIKYADCLSIEGEYHVIE